MLAIVTYQFWATGRNSNGNLGLGLDPAVNGSISSFTKSSNPAFNSFADFNVYYTHVLAIGSDNTLYGWGENDQSQLTSDISGTQSSPTEIPWFKTNNKNPKRISVGDGFSIVQTGGRELYAFGYNYDGQLGINSIEEEATQPTFVDLSNLASNEIITDIQSDYEISYLQTNLGNLYYWGNCQSCICPGEADYTPIKLPTKAEISHNVTKFFLVNGSFWFITTNQELYVMGQNIEGRLCIGENAVDREVATPQLITSLQNVKKIVAGHPHSIILQEDGKLFMCGSNQYKQFGNDSVSDSLTPFEITYNFGDIIDIAATYTGSIILSTTGVYSVGSSNAGELSLDGVRTQNNFNQISITLESSINRINSYFDLSFLYFEERIQGGNGDGGNGGEGDGNGGDSSDGNGNGGDSGDNGNGGENGDQIPDDTVNPENPSALSPGAIAGISIAVIVVVAAIVVGSTLGVLAKKKMLLARGASAAAYAPHSGAYATRVV